MAENKHWIGIDKSGSIVTTNGHKPTSSMLKAKGFEKIDNSARKYMSDLRKNLK